MAVFILGCYLPAPYLDEYGETDPSLKRGNPLKLCETLYKELEARWLSHGIPEKVVHTMESNTSFNPDWHYF